MTTLCRQVEWHPDHHSTKQFSGIGNFAYIPIDSIKAVGIERAFQTVTKHPAHRIIFVDPDGIFNEAGDPVNLIDEADVKPENYAEPNAVLFVSDMRRLGHAVFHYRGGSIYTGPTVVLETKSALETARAGTVVQTTSGAQQERQIPGSMTPPNTVYWLHPVKPAHLTV
jgi:hypothetical protein